MQAANSLTFVQCNLNHCDLLHETAVQSYNEHYTHIWDDHGRAYLKRFYDKQVFERSLKSDSNHHYLIYLEGTPVGFFKLKENGLAPFRDEDCLELNKLYILKDYTGQSVGHRTMKFIFELTRRKNRHLLWLNVMAESKAKSFYEHFGFESCHEVALDYPHMKAGLNILFTYKLELTKS